MHVVPVPAGQDSLTDDFLYPPPPMLADCVYDASVKTLPGGDYMLPAGLRPLFLVILQGRLVVDSGGTAQTMPQACLCGSSRHARRAWAAPGTRILTISIRAGKMRCLVDAPALAVAETWTELADLLRGEDRGELQRCLAKLSGTEDCHRQVADFLDFLGGLRWRRREAPADLCFPSTLLQISSRELADRLGLGLRQFERRFLASYGQSHRSFRQQLRSSQLLKAYVSGGCNKDSWAALAADFGYYDQSHFIRETHQFTGHTPSQLAAGITSRDPAFWPYLVNPLHIHRLFGSTGY